MATRAETASVRENMLMCGFELFVLGAFVGVIRSFRGLSRVGILIVKDSGGGDKGCQSEVT